jgi:membrane protein DedA with SNARE-associated domain/rhodanese-related sulfurtransferase
MPSLAGMTTIGPLIAFASVCAGSLGVPIPTFAALVFVGSLMATRHESLGMGAGVFAAAIAGALLGDIAWFLAGRRHGTRVLGLLCRLSLSRDSCVRRTADVFARRGLKVLLVARFVPGLSVLSAPVAGASGVGLAEFLAYAETGAAVWIGTGLLLGFWFADQVSALLLSLKQFGLGLAGVATAVIVGYAGFSWFRRMQLLRRLRMARISADALAALIASDAMPVIIDARSKLEQDEDPFVLPGALLHRNGEVAPALASKSKLGPIVIYCSCPNEISSAVIAGQLRRMGFVDVRPLIGGIDAWRVAGHPVEPIRRSSSATAADAVHSLAALSPPPAVSR